MKQSYIFVDLLVENTAAYAPITFEVVMIVINSTTVYFHVEVQVAINSVLCIISAFNNLSFFTDFNETKLARIVMKQRDCWSWTYCI